MMSTTCISDFGSQRDWFELARRITVDRSAAPSYGLEGGAEHRIYQCSDEAGTLALGVGLQRWVLPPSAEACLTSPYTPNGRAASTPRDRITPKKPSVVNVYGSHAMITSASSPNAEPTPRAIANGRSMRSAASLIVPNNRSRPSLKATRRATSYPTVLNRASAATAATR